MDSVTPSQRARRPAGRSGGLICGLSAASIVIVVVSAVIGALAAIAVVVVLRSGLLHPGDHHGHHAGETGPAAGSLAARLEMLEHAIEDELNVVKDIAARELNGVGVVALKSMGHSHARPTQKPGVGASGGRLGLHAHDTSTDAEEHASRLRDKAAVPIPAAEIARATQELQPSTPANHHMTESSNPWAEGGADEAEEDTATGGQATGTTLRAPSGNVRGFQAGSQGSGDSSVVESSTLGPQASDSSDRTTLSGAEVAASGLGTADGKFAGAIRTQSMAKCEQIETDGRLRLRVRERTKFPSLQPLNRWAEVSGTTPADCPQRPNRDYKSHPVTIFQPGRGAGKVPDGRFDCPAGKILKCPFDCFITGDSAKAATADVTLSVVPGASALKKGHCPLQKQALFSMENEVYYPNLALSQANMASWDFMGTTHLASDVPLGYGGWYDFNYLEPPTPKTAGAMAVAVISNCAGHNGRLQYIRKLMAAGVSVHHVGQCDHNHDWKPPTGESKGRFVDKIDMLRTYKFTLAFENTNVNDYVTEKYFQPLVAGSVPVYMGAPNSEIYAPSAHSVIRTDDFPTAEALAEYMIYLSRNEEAYNALLNWKFSGVSKGFQRAMAATTDVHSQCRLCRLVRETLEVEVGDSTAMSAEQLVPMQTKEEAPGAVPYKGLGM